MTDNHLKYIIKEALTQTDENQIGGELWMRRMFWKNAIK